MPAAIPIAVLAASAAATTAASAGVIAASTAALISVGIGIAGTLAQTLLSTQPPKPKMQDGSASIKQSIPPRTRCYGTYRLAGTYFYYDSTSEGDLRTGVCHAAHQCDAFVEHWLNEDIVTIDAGHKVHGGVYDNYDPILPVSLHNFLGTPTQTIDSLPDDWTTDGLHHGRGLCATVVNYSDIRQELQLKVYPGGPPAYRATLRGALIFDPRDGTQTAGTESTYKWSDNAALVLLDYLTRREAGIPVGFGMAFAKVDAGPTGSFATAATVCDQAIPLKAGGTEKRWRSCGAYDLTEDRKTVLADLLDACGGRLTQGPDGKIGLTVGAPSPTAAVTIGDAQIIDWSDLTPGPPAITRINEVRATYVSRAQAWAQVEAGIQFDQTGIDRNGPESSAINLRFVPSDGQAQRVAKFTLKHGNPEWSGKVRGTLALLDAWGERWITLQIAELEIDQVFEITGMRLNQGNMTVEIDVTSYDGWWDWTAATDEQDAAAVPTASPPLGNITPPAGVIATVMHRQYDARTIIATAVISWTAPTSASLNAQGRWRKSGGVWQSIGVNPGEVSFETPPLENGQVYEASVRFIGSRGTVSAWTDVAPFTALADPTAPAVPTALSATPSGATVILSATAGNSVNQAALRFWRDSDSTFAGAVDVSGPVWTGANETGGYVDTPGPGAWRYWATTENWSAVKSAPVGPAATITFTPAAPVIVSPTTPYVTNDNTPTFSGTGPNGTTVHLFDGVTDVGNAAVVALAWSVTASTLADGTRNVTAVAVAPGPVSSVASNTVVTTIDTVSQQPVITTASPINTTDTTPDISGTSENGAAISVYRGGSTLAGTTTADGSGNWTCTLSTLAVGPYSGIVAKAVDALGNPQSAASSPAKTLNINPLAPSITTSSATIGNTNPVVAGTSTASASIGVYADGVLNQTVAADGSGNWTATLAGLTAGARSITARQTVAGLTSADSTAITLTVQWNDPTADGHADFKGNQGWLLGSTAALTAIFGTITTSAQLVTMANGQLKSIAANALPLSDLGLEYWETRTNRCTNKNANPITSPAASGVTLSGDPAAALTLYDDSASMVGSDILALLKTAGTISGFCYFLNNVSGTTDAFATIAGTVAATGACNASVVYRGSAGRIEVGGVTAVSFPVSAAGGANFSRANGQRTAAATSEQMRVVAPAGAAIVFIMNQMENGPYPSAPIIVNSATATRLQPVITRSLSTDFDGTQGFVGTRMSIPAGIVTNGVPARFDTPDATHTHFLQATAATAILGASTNVTNQALPNKTIAMTSTRTVLYGWASNDFALSVDGTAPVTDVSGTVPSTSTPVLKVSVTGSGIIEQIKWAALKPSNSVLQTKSGWTVL